MNGTGQRRSKRLKTQETSRKAATSNASATVSYLQVGTLRGQNVKGLATLPDELLLEILAKFPSFTTPKRSYTPTGFDLQSHNTRRGILNALCLACKNLRRFFLPYLWEYIESYGGLQFEGRSIERPEHPSQEKACAMELIRQLEMVTVRIPSLARYVRVIDAVIVKYSEATVLAELARCMALLPNLKTVKFVEPTDTRYSGSRRASPERPAWRRAFEGTSYPQIQNALLAPPFYGLAKSILDLRSLQPIENIEFSNSSCLDFVQNPAILQAFYLPILCIKLDPEVYTNIRHLELTITCYLNPYFSISHFKHLDRVTLDISSDPSAELTADLAEVTFAHLIQLQKEDARDKFFLLQCTVGDITVVAVTMKSAEPGKKAQVPPEMLEGGRLF